MPQLLSFLLGFYVNLVVTRWWTQYKLLPWPDNLAMIISYAIPNSNGETGRLMRRNIMRYMVLAYVITLQRISLRVKRRFPTPQHLVDAGLMMESERKIFDTMNAKSPMSKYWMPLVWGTNIINRARKDGVITSDQIVQSILSELKDIRTRLGGLIGFDTVCVPLVYTQVATIACYTYFIALLIGRQMIPSGEHTTKTRDDEKFPDLFFPLFTFLQFIFYLGWLKVAEVLINPFGEDDDDIELNWLIDRHIKTSYMIVDEMHEEYPELLKDQYWEEVVPKDLPYTVASEHYRRHEPKGSAENYKIKQADSMYANILPSKRMRDEDTYADYESVDTPMAERRKSSNWISRQVSRMGSIRSQSTAYSSGGLFNRHRLNSVYSSPESGLPPGISQPPQGKPGFYDKFVNRKSLRNHRQLIKQSSKLTLNGMNQSSAPKTSRPRIPTPDVSDKDGKINLNFATTVNGNAPSSTASGVAVVAQNLSKNPLVYPTDDKFASCKLLLSPITESDCSSSNNTLQPGHPATAALAQACLPKNFQAAIPTTTTLPVTSIAFPTTTRTVSLVPLHSGGIPEITTTPPNHEAIPSIALQVTIPTDTSTDSIKELLQGDTIDGIINFQDNQGNTISRSGSFSLSHSKILTPTDQTLPAGSVTLTTSSSASQLQQPELILTPNNFDQSTSAPSTLTKREVQEAKHSEVYV